MALTGPGSSYAFVVEGKDYGLALRAADESINMTNLEPGDIKKFVFRYYQ